MTSPSSPQHSFAFSRPHHIQPPLFQPTSSADILQHSHTHTPHEIRAATVQLSNMPFEMAGTDPGNSKDTTSPRLMKEERGKMRAHMPLPSRTSSDDNGAGAGVDVSGNLIFPKPKIHHTSSIDSSSSLPILPLTEGPHTATFSSESLLVNLNLEPDETSALALGASVGTLSSLAPSSMLTMPPSSYAGSSSDEMKGKEDEKKKKRKPSGLSLSRPSSDASSEGSDLSSRASSSDSDFRNHSDPDCGRGRARQSLFFSMTSPIQNQGDATRYRMPSMSPTLSPAATATPRLPFGTVDEGNGNGSTPTGTPMGTPKARPGVLPSREAEGQRESGHVRWKSPLRVGREVEKYVELPNPPPLPKLDENEDERMSLLPEVGYGYSTFKGDDERGLMSRFEVLHRVENHAMTDDQDSDGGGGGQFLSKKPKLKPKPFAFWFWNSVSTPKSVGVSGAKDRVIKLLLEQAPQFASVAVGSIPAVLLGSLLNILDGVSCKLFLPFF